MKKRIYRIIIFVCIIGSVFLFNNLVVINNQNLNSDFIGKLSNVSGKLIIGPTYDQNQYIDYITGKYLNIQMYELSFPQIIEQILDFRKSNNEVKIMLEDNIFNGKSNYNKILGRMFPYGIQLKNDKELKTNYIHSKVIITDKNYIIQSGNLSYSSIFRNREHIFIGNNDEIRKNLDYLFKKDRNGEKIQESDIVANLLICNINCRYKIETLIQNAQESILMQVQYISDPSIIQLIDNANINEIKIITGKGHKKEDSIEINDFIRIYKKNYIHTKTILIDNKYLIIGSMNLSSNSLDNNREHGIIITDKAIIKQFMKSFEADRENSEK